jgi:hypothetical protein
MQKGDLKQTSMGSDVAHFHLGGVDNKRNMRLCASENPEKVHHAPRITSSVAI